MLKLEESRGKVRVDKANRIWPYRVNRTRPYHFIPRQESVNNTSKRGHGGICIFYNFSMVELVSMANSQTLLLTARA